MLWIFSCEPITTAELTIDDVTNVTTKSLNGAVQLTWIPPDEKDFDHCILFYGTEYTPQEEWKNNVSSTGAIVTGLENNQSYNFIIKSVNEIGAQSDGVRVSAKTTSK